MQIFLAAYGFFSPFNCLTANKDIRQKKFNKVCINDSYIRFKIEKDVGLKYGFIVINVSNRYNLNPINILGIRTYNRLMKEAFIKQNGEIQYNKYVNELDSTQLQIIEK